MSPTTASTRERFAALVGNPNVGKSTLFNALTGLRQKVANYPGVTVDANEGTLEKDGVGWRLVDLPGTYSLRPKAADDAIVRDVLTGIGAQAPDVVVVTLDATNLRRNLFLLTEAMDLGLPVVAVLNMVDEARRAGVEVPTSRLRELTGIPVLETVATRSVGIDDLRAALVASDQVPDRVWRFADAALEKWLEAAPGSSSWRRLEALRKENPAALEQEIAGRYAWINEVMAGQRNVPGARGRTERIDRFLLHPVAGPAMFLLVMGLVFQSIFTWSGPLMDLIDTAFGSLSASAGSWLPPILGDLGTSLVTDGIIAGVGAVLIFLPQILILFLFLGFLEDTGYMSRAAFLVDRPLRALGLSGRSFIPLLSSFACAIPGVLAARTIPSRSERLLAIFVAPLMTCSARLPVYTLLISAFLPQMAIWGFIGLQGLVLFGLYMAGMLAAVVVALLVSRNDSSRGRELPLVVELPPYRRPTLRGVLLKLRVRAGDFLKRAGTLIFVISVVLWVLMAFPRAEMPAGVSDEEAAALQLKQSVAGRLGQAIEPVIRPLGFDWKMGVGLIASFAAREVFVSTMGVVYSVGGEVDEEDQGLRKALKAARDPETGKPSFSLATVFSLLVFYVFALQCGATVAVVKRETRSWRFALGQLLTYMVMAWVASLVTFQGLSALGY